VHIDGVAALRIGEQVTWLSKAWHNDAKRWRSLYRTIEKSYHDISCALCHICEELDIDYLMIENVFGVNRAVAGRMPTIGELVGTINNRVALLKTTNRLWKQEVDRLTRELAAERARSNALAEEANEYHEQLVTNASANDAANDRGMDGAG
jgi:hypothetical protein